MPTDGRAILNGYLELDAALVAEGRHPTSAPFLETLSRFWLSGRRRLVLRKGRQSGGSTTLARVAVATALFGEHRAPPGTRLTIPFISVKMSEASERLHNIEDALGVLGEPCRRSGDSIELTARGITFQAFPCAFRFAVGMTSCAAFEDEVARWRSDDAMANPADEVDAAIVPSLATQPNGRVYTCSSPLGFDDFHAKLMQLGETNDQCVAEGPSWFWNPTITEAGTRSLMPDERKWRREFAAIPQAGALSAFDFDAVTRAFEPRSEMGTPRRRVMLIDASSGKKDAWTFGIAGWNHTSMGRFLCFDLIDGIEGSFFGKLTGDAIVERLARIAHAHDVRTVHGDQRESLMLSSAFGRPRVLSPGTPPRRLYFTEHAWTSSSKPEAVEIVRRWFADGAITLPKHEKLRSELLNFEERISASGAFTFGARGSGHDDYVSLLLTAAMADAVDELSPPAHILVPRQEGRDPPLRNNTHRVSLWNGSGKGRGWG